MKKLQLGSIALISILFAFMMVSCSKKDNSTPESSGTASGTGGGESNQGNDVIAGFSVSSSTVLIGETVQFTDTSRAKNGSINSWSWDFGDGNSSTDQNPEHTYQSKGDFTVNLTVKNDKEKSDEASKKIKVVATDEVQPTIVWQTSLTERFEAASPALSDDGMLYIGNNAKEGRGKYNFFAIKDGKVQWKYAASDVIRSTAAVGSDGTAYIGDYADNFYAFKSDGIVKWETGLDGYTKYSSPAIATDGTIYVGTTGKLLYAINPDGTIKWKVSMDGNVYCSPSIGSDGTVYVASTGGKLYAVDPSGSIKWKSDCGGWNGSNIAIASDGTIYFCGEQNSNGNKGIFIAFNPDGSQKWQKDFPGKLSYGGPAISKDGTIYVGSRGDKKLMAFNPDGTLKWDFDCDEVKVVPAIDNQGNIYFGDVSGTFYVLKPDGTLKYKSIKLGVNIWSGAIIGDDGTIYVGADQKDDTGILYALKTVASGPASSWSMKGKDRKHTGNISN